MEAIKIKKKVQWYLTLIFTFLLGNYQGYIALWASQTEKPDIVFPYSVSSLPVADQNALNSGIQIDSRDELRQILEDYLS